MSSQKQSSDGATASLQRICAALVVTSQPLTRAQLREIAGDVDENALNVILADAAQRLEALGLLLVQDEAGVMIGLTQSIRKDLARYFAAHAPALSAAAMEVLTVVAYNQPVSKQKIDEIRGVASDASIKTLLTRGLIRADRAKAAEPVYITTPQFLALVGLRTLADLPKAVGVKRAT